MTDVSVLSKICIDTNILVRIFVGDDEAQQKMALDVLENAELVVIPTTVLMETVWVLSHSYKISKIVILDLLTDFIKSVPNISVRKEEVSVGFALMKQLC